MNTLKQLYDGIRDNCAEVPRRKASIGDARLLETKQHLDREAGRAACAAQAGCTEMLRLFVAGVPFGTDDAERTW